MKKHKGFSLIELIVVMAIIAILIAIIIPSYDNIIKGSQKSKLDEAIRETNSTTVRNLQDYNGITSSNLTDSLKYTLTPVLLASSDLLSTSTTHISYFSYYYDDITLVQNKFKEIYDTAPYASAPDNYNITICIPDNERHSDSSITFNLNHSVYIIVKTVDNTYIYKNGLDVTSDFLPSSP